jgi:hypothetical protein
MDAIADAFQESFALTERRVPTGVPALVIKSPQEGREMGPEIDDLVAADAITQGVQGR